MACSSPVTRPATAFPVTAEGIRTAIYFGLACGREIRAVLDGGRTREQALATYGAFSDAHERKYRWLLNVQRTVGRMMPSRAVTALSMGVENRAVTAWAFGHYLDIAPPSFVTAGGRGISASARDSLRTPSSMAGSARLA